MLISELPTYTVFSVSIGTFIHLGKGVVLPLGGQDGHHPFNTRHWGETEVTILAEAVA